MKSLEELSTDKTVFSIGQALSDGWSLVSKNIGYYILGGIIAVLVGLVVSFIPIIGSFANNVILSPCFMAGAIFVTWNISKGKGWTDFGDMFKGFNFLQPNVISTIIQGAVGLLFAGLIFFNHFDEIFNLFKLAQGADAFTNQEAIRIALIQLFDSKFMVSLLLFISAFLFISALWAFKSHFIVIYNMQAWPAMEMSRKIARHNLLKLIGLYLIMSLIIIISAIPCGIGLLFSLPLLIGSLYSAFAQITHCDQDNEISADTFDFMANQ